MTVFPTLKKQRQVVPGVLQPANIAELVTSRFRERPCLKKTKWIAIQEITCCKSLVSSILSLHMYTQLRTRTHTRTQTHTYTHREKALLGTRQKSLDKKIIYAYIYHICTHT